MSFNFDQISGLEPKGEESSKSSSLSSSDHDGSGAVLPMPNMAANANHLLLVALLEYVCSLHVSNRRKREKLFKVLCSQLAQMNIMSPLVAMEELSTVRSQYKQSFSKLLHHSVTKLKMDWCPALPDPSADPRHFHENRLPRLKQPSLGLSQLMGFHTSRYRDEYEELELLGQGAYGCVFKVKHKLDSKVYAVKKVAFQDTSPDLWYKTLREVKHLADLNHASVIRYYTAWLEYQLPLINIQDKTRRRTQDDFDLPALTYYHDDQDSESDSSSSHCCEIVDPSSDSNVVFQDISPRPRRKYNRTNSWELPGPDGTRSDWFKQQRGDDSHDPSLGSDRGNNDVVQHSYVALYIQMELCCQTLRDWLQDRNNKLTSSKEVYSSVDEARNLYILREVLNGVNYLHCQNLIHRDLKPGNIFLNIRPENELEVKIGDFGLVRQTAASSDPSEHDSEPMTPAPGLYKDHIMDMNGMFLTSGVGTTIYASPEQLAGVGYGPKSDMYSIGLIKLEMYQPFCTGMERSKILIDLRKGKLCSEFMERWPVESEVIHKLIDLDPEQRPSAKELLSGRLFHTEEQMIDALKRMLSEKEEECKKKNQQLQEKDKVIKHLECSIVEKDKELEKLRTLLNPMCEHSS